MSRLLAGIARALARHWIRGLVAIILTFVVVGAVVGSQDGSAPEDFSIPGTEAQKALDLLEERFPEAAGAQSTVVFTVKDGTLRDPERRALIGEALARINKLPNVVGAPDPVQVGTISPDSRTAFTTVAYDKQILDLKPEDGERLIEAAHSAERDGIDVELRGETIDYASQNEAPVGELVGIAMAIILLTILFRRPGPAFVTLFAALVGVAFSQLFLHAIAKPLGIPDLATVLAVMLGLGAGIDYSMLILSRFREQVADGDDVPEAAARANRTAGMSVVAAGVIVMIAIAGLMAVGIPMVGKMGIGTAIAVAAVVVSSVTALPVFIGMLKRFLRPKKPEHVAPSAVFSRWGGLITRRPVTAVVVGVVALLVVAVPTLDMRLGQPDDGNQPTSKTQRRAYDQLSAAFGPGFNGPLLLAIEARDGGRVQPAALKRLQQSLEGVDGVASVGQPTPNQAGDAAVLEVIPTTSPQDERTSDLINNLRDDVLPKATQETGLKVYVGGQTAGFMDFSAKIAARLPVFILIVCGLSIVLLMAAFRSVLVPLASALFNLLAIGASYGVVVAVFQKGWGNELIGADSDVPIVSFVPLFMFAILFGLSMDYNVFLLSRIREAYFEGDRPADSVIHGLSRIARVVLVAGLVMTSVFLAFVHDDDIIIKMVGLGLGVAVLLDVLVIRLLISPALITLLGHSAWWMPRWLDRILPNISLEGDHDSRREARAERKQQEQDRVTT